MFIFEVSRAVKANCGLRAGGAARELSPLNAPRFPTIIKAVKERLAVVAVIRFLSLGGVIMPRFPVRSQTDIKSAPICVLPSSSASSFFFFYSIDISPYGNVFEILGSYRRGVVYFIGYVLSFAQHASRDTRRSRATFLRRTPYVFCGRWLKKEEREGERKTGLNDHASSVNGYRRHSTGNTLLTAGKNSRTRRPL